MDDLNKIFFLGNLTRDPELKYTDEGNTYTELSIAINKHWKGKDGKEVQSVNFVTVTCWNGLAQNSAASLHRGDRVMAAGYIKYKTQEKEGKTYGRIYMIADVVAASLEFNEVLISGG